MDALPPINSIHTADEYNEYSHFDAISGESPFVSKVLGYLNKTVDGLNNGQGFEGPLKDIYNALKKHVPDDGTVNNNNLHSHAKTIHEMLEAFDHVAAYPPTSGAIYGVMKDIYKDFGVNPSVGGNG